jgi:hypothetical protein
VNGNESVVAKGTGLVAHVAYDLEGQLASVQGHLLELGPGGGVFEAGRAVIPDAALMATVALTTPAGVLIVRLAHVDGAIARFTLLVRDNPTLMTIQGALLSD